MNLGSSTKGRDDGIGVACAIGAFTAWGLLPLYWRRLAEVSALDLIAQRIVWSLVVVIGLLIAGRRLKELRQAFASWPVLRGLLIATLLLGPNWLVYVWAVNAGRVLETSFGYFVNPLISVALGRLVLGETLQPWQRVAIALAGMAVAWLTIADNTPPWIGLFLAATFGIYGLMRKITPVGSLPSLAVETIVLAPLALGVIGLQAVRGYDAFARLDDLGDAMLVASGLVTAGPLLLFAMAARCIRLTTLGLCQYLNPSLQFGLAIVVYGEAASMSDLLAIGPIWMGLAIYTLDARRADTKS